MEDEMEDRRVDRRSKEEVGDEGRVGEVEEMLGGKR